MRAEKSGAPTAPAPLALASHLELETIRRCRRHAGDGRSAECAACAVHRAACAGLYFSARRRAAGAVSRTRAGAVRGRASALAWNYFFLPPRFTFIITSTEDGVLFGLYFVVAIVLGQLVARIRAQELAERQREKRATALYQLTRELAQVGTRDEIVWRLVAEVDRVFQASTPSCCRGKIPLPRIPTVRSR
ncbi:MAG: DUF4118 domain-containing protein [Limisphaerales bacterium]